VTLDLDRILLDTANSADLDKIGALRHKISIENLLSNDESSVYYQDRSKVAEIVKTVQLKGDKALADYTEKFDNVKLTPAQFRIPASELKAAHDNVSSELLGSIKRSIDNVRKYQTEVLSCRDNKHSGIKYTPLKRVGICVPGASAPLPSTVIMTAVPAIAAGVKEVVVISPPRCSETIHPVILGVCQELGIREVYRIGGAQAVAALAWGTETIAKVDKIVGPGNIWTQLAKREVFGVVDIDSIAGPSEVLIIADETADPDFVAADMLSQAEHASDSSAVVLTHSKNLAQAVISSLVKQLQQLDRGTDAVNSLTQYSGVVVTKDIEQSINLANEFAPEHLEIHCGDNSRAVVDKIENAGAIFVGPYTPVAVGDYYAGPSHTLPTGTSARFFSALSSNDFVKSTSIIEYDRDQLNENAADIIRLANIEGLDAHAKSVQIREKK